MKKLICLLLTVVFVLALCSCSCSCSCGNSGPNTTSQPEYTLPADYEPSTALVAYFSPTDSVKNIASKLSTALKSNETEIIPEQAYTAEDLNLKNKESRAFKEAVDSSARPEISNDIYKFEQYDTIFIGFPVWYNDAPKIIYSFIDKFDLTGKDIYIFTVSESETNIGSTQKLDTYLASKATIVDSRGFTPQSTQEDIQEWVNETPFATENNDEQ